MKYYNEIYQLQQKLNIIIGRDTVNDKDKLKWGTDYYIALMSEAQELMNCISWKWWTVEGKQNQYKKIIDLENAKIEAIDCLHFIISLIQVYNIQIPQNDNLINQTDIFSLALELNNRCVFGININAKRYNLEDSSIPSIDDILKNQLIFDNKEKHTKNISICFAILKQIFKILKMSDEDIYKIYQMKYEKNILRQKNKYSVATKTEEDNDEIKEKIKKC